MDDLSCPTARLITEAINVVNNPNYIDNTNLYSQPEPTNAADLLLTSQAKINSFEQEIIYLKQHSQELHKRLQSFQELQTSLNNPLSEFQLNSASAPSSETLISADHNSCKRKCVVNNEEDSSITFNIPTSNQFQLLNEHSDNAVNSPQESDMRNVKVNIPPINISKKCHYIK